MTKKDSEITELRTRVRNLETVLGQRDKRLLATFKLTPVMNSLMGLLLELPIVSTETIHNHTEIAANAKVAAYRLRRLLKPYDIEVHSRRNVGYWFSDDDKKKIRELISEEAA